MSGGGAETRFRLLAQHLFEGTAEAAVLVRDDTEGSRAIWLGWTGRSSYLRVATRLRRLLRNGCFDAVVGFSVYPAALVRLACLGLSPRPAIVGMEVTRPLAVRALVQGTWRAPAMDLARRIAFSGVDAFAANSIDGLAENVSRFGVDPSRSRRVHNILDLDWLTSQSAIGDEVVSGSTASFNICVVGRLETMKRVDTVIRAATALPTDVDWNLYIAGAGPAETDLRRLVATLEVSSRVNFIGWRNNPHALMTACDVFVLPSQFEGFSNSLMEALALGIPSIASLHSSDAAEMAQGGAVLGFPPGDTAALKEALLAVFRDEGLRGALRSKGRRYVAGMETHVVMREYEDVIVSAIQSRFAGLR